MTNGGLFMDIEFKSLEELYQRLKPALKARCQELARNGYPYLKEEDIWNYLKEIKWKSSSDLSLAEMVSDVFNIEDLVIDNYLRTKLNSSNRKIYFEEKQ